MSTLNVGTLTTTNGIVLPSFTTGNYPAGVIGKLIYDSSTQEIKVFNGTTWDGLFPQYFADILIVGGGGGAGSSFGGGGGGGGVIYLRGYPLVKGQSFTVEVGGGGAGRPTESDSGIPAQSGGRSGLGCHFAAGGGGGVGRGGGAVWGQPALPGGSGGGACHSNSAPKGIPGEGIPGQGFMGGWGRDNVSGVPNHAAGGGGGAGQTGGDYREGSAGGKGGDGLPYDISGSLVYYGAGGGGGIYTDGSGGLGGLGGGGEGGRNQGGQLTSGTSGTGIGSGGGGGGYQFAGGNGTTGIVIVRYTGAQRGTGGSVSTSGGFTRHTFNTIGTLTYTV